MDDVVRVPVVDDCWVVELLREDVVGCVVVADVVDLAGCVVVLADERVPVVERVAVVVRDEPDCSTACWS